MYKRNGCFSLLWEYFIFFHLFRKIEVTTLLPQTYLQISEISMDLNIIAMDKQAQKHRLSVFFKDSRNIKVTAEQTV